MSEQDVVSKVGEMMQSMDEVKKYRELAYALIDFAGIFVLSIIVAVIIVLIGGVYEIANGFANGGFPLYFLSPNGAPLPETIGTLISFIPLAGFLVGVIWIGRRVDRVKTGEWKETLDEGVPGAVKLLSETDWDSLLSTVSLSRVSFLFYAIVKVIGYSLFIGFLLTLGEIFIGGLIAYTFSFVYIAFASVALALLINRKSLEKAFKRLRALDLLFWDLRWFYSEFKRAEFNKA
jgi:ABC-type glycerol-3-phosphate transport system permease component